MPLHITSEPEPNPDDLRQLEDSIYDFNMRTTGIFEYTPVHLFLRDEAGNRRGGVLGGIWGGWLHLTFLWVDEPLRGQGYGRQLLDTMEAAAREHHCLGIFLETHSFQAPDFYRKAGYEVIGEIDDYPTGHAFYFLRKPLTD